MTADADAVVVSPGACDVAAIKAHGVAATEGPWLLDGGPDDVKTVLGPITFGGMRVTAKTIAEYVESDADAVFIAHAREDVPVLVAEVERLRAALNGVRALHDDWQKRCPCACHRCGELDDALGDALGVQS